TINIGSHQNPQDLSANTWTLVRFKETESNGKVDWTFFKDQCRHCLEPPCKAAADDYAPGSIIMDSTGALIFLKATQKITEDLEEMCPYSIPQKDEKSGSWFKCNFCHDRIANGQIPACVKACPTGALVFGDRKEVMALAKQRLQEIKKDHPDAMLLDADDVRWIYLLHEPETYFQIGLRELDRFDRYAWRKLLQPTAPVSLAVGGLALLFEKREQRMKAKQKDEV
ncbi:MAG: 4Fe-4S dicluster domain-containing protein, partial [bacterium]|nr:4Fe-4S dicluster domain-containing protein [bacterium]